MADRLDIVLFGASGFTGKYCIGHIHRLSKANGQSLTWGVAGRSEEKTRKALDEYNKKISDELSNVPVLIADINNYESLKKMTARARVLINCCGPYRFVGEPVIKACLETGTHQVDVTGEPQFIETMQLKYHKQAEEKGIYIISSCGFDSIPHDLGVIFLQKNFKGTLHSVETYFEADEQPPRTYGSLGNYTTWKSFIYHVAHDDELHDIRHKLYPTRLPNFKPILEARSSVHKSDVVNLWCVPLVSTDRSVMVRSQRYFYDEKKMRPVQVQTYMGLNSIIDLMAMLVLKGLFNFLIKYEFGINMLLKYPKFFSGGIFSHESPPEQKMNKYKFSITFYGKGWSEKLVEAEDEYTVPPNKTIIAKLSGMNPAYGVTCYGVTLASIVILTEKDKLPGRGGVYPPGAAFAETTFIKQLQENGLSFEILSSE